MEERNNDRNHEMVNVRYYFRTFECNLCHYRTDNHLCVPGKHFNILQFQINFGQNLSKTTEMLAVEYDHRH